MSEKVGNQKEFISAFVIALSSPAVKQSMVEALAESIRTNAAQGVIDATETLRNEITLLRKELRQRDKTIADLDQRISELQLKCDQQEQYSRRTSVRISGIPEEEGEDVLSKVKDTLNSIGVDPVVQRCHRVRRFTQKKNPPASDSHASVPPQPRQILVQFTGQLDKINVMRNKNRLDKSHIFINEDLTKPRARLLYLARQLKNQKKLQGAWSADGRILVKDNKGVIRTVVVENDLKTI